MAQTKTIVKKAVIPTVSGHFLANGVRSVASNAQQSSRHAITGQAKQVAIQLGTRQPNTDRRRYVTHS